MTMMMTMMMTPRPALLHEAARCNGGTMWARGPAPA
jgi:hypothetical protein